MASGLQSDPWLLQLPDERLSAVLRCCADDIRSVFSAARAHSRLHKAAALAVSSITAMGLEQEQARSILVYLGIHGQHVDSIDLRSNGHTASLRQLPHNKLQKLSSLNVSRCRLQLQPGYGFQGVLWAGAPLKQLRLESCMLSDNIEQVAAALSLLPELQHLCFDGNQLSNKSRLCFPSSVLQKLQQLTYLELAGNQLEGPDGLQHVHDLTCLQDLRLQYVSGSNIQACWLSGLQKLTQLKFLGSYDFEPSCLAGKTQLQHLYLSVSSARTEQLLSHLQHMHQLTHVVLSLQGSVIAPAAAYSALTASSKLQHLMIYHCQLPAGAWQHMFPAARQLPQLKVLDLSNVCKPDSASPALGPRSKPACQLLPWAAGSAHRTLAVQC